MSTNINVKNPIYIPTVKMEISTSPPRGYKTWNEYYSKTGDWSVDPATTILAPSRKIKNK